MWGLLIFVIVILAISAAVALLRRHRASVPASLFFRRTALIFLAACTLVIGVFLAGETIADPGGWQAAGVIALWLVPLAVLTALAAYQPGWATVALAILVAGAVALAVWYVVDPAWWHGLENTRGPVRGVITFILVLPAALVGWRSPLTGAVLLLVLGLAPLLISAAGPGRAAASLTALSIPPILGGFLYLLAAWPGRRPPAPAPPT